MYNIKFNNIVSKERIPQGIEGRKLRARMAKYQESLFELIDGEIEGNPGENFAEHLKEVKKIILEYLNGKIENYGDPIGFDMSKLVTEEYKDDITQVLKLMIKKIKDLEGITTSNFKRKYLYVVQRYDGMVVVVGQSTFKDDLVNQESGDLFYRLYMQGLSGSESMIITSKYGLEVYDTLEEYYKYAWIIPVPNIVNNYKVDNESITENGLGIILTRNKVPMLNYYSHLNPSSN